MTKNNKDELEKALTELKKLDELIVSSFFVSATLALIARKPAHLGSLGTAYLLGTRKGVYQAYKTALNGQDDTYPGLFGKNETLNNAYEHTCKFFSMAQKSMESSDIPKKVQDAMNDIFRKK